MCFLHCGVLNHKRHRFFHLCSWAQIHGSGISVVVLSVRHFKITMPLNARFHSPTAQLSTNNHQLTTARKGSIHHSSFIIHHWQSPPSSPDGATEYRRGCNPRLGVAIKHPLPRASGAREGKGWVVRVTGGYASLAPVYILSPLQGYTRALTANHKQSTTNNQPLTVNR